MYTKLEISQFRAFSSLTAAPLNRLNLISGDNNIGKTGVLEAIYLAHATNYERLKRLPGLFRRTQEGNGTHGQDEIDNFWLWLFHRRELTRAWEIKLTGEQSVSLVRGELAVGDPTGQRPFTDSSSLSSANLRLRHQFDDAPPINGSMPLYPSSRFYEGGSEVSPVNVTAFSTRFEPPASDAELVNTLKVNNEIDELIEYLHLVEPRLVKLDYLRLKGHQFPYIYADIGFGRGKQLIPATQLGHGFARLLRLFATLMVNKPNVVLIDEFEDGLQHDALTPVWKSLGQFARSREIQIFATTHSYECIQAAHEAASTSPDYDLSVVRLQESRAKEVEAVVLDHEMIETALDARLELR